MFDLIQPRSPLELEFKLSLAVDLPITMHLVVYAPSYEGFDKWIYDVHAALPDDLRADMDVVLRLVHKYVLFTRVPLDDPIHRSFPALVSQVAAWGEDDFRQFVQTSLDGQATYYQETHGGPLALPALDDRDALRAWLSETEFPARHLDQAIALIHDPGELKVRYISIMTRFWDRFYRDEFQRVLPLMERSIQYHRRQNYKADLETLFTAVTGRLPDEELDAYRASQRAIFCPSCHMGLYVSIMEVQEPLPALILVYNCRSTGMAGQEQAPAVQELYPPLKALADETRLQILSMLDGHEMYAQQIVERLQISQPAVSRHLALMVAAGVLTVRQENSMKYYSLNDPVLAALGDRLGKLRGKATM